MSKHTRYDLVQMQSLPLEAKINMSKRRIREWYEHWDGEVYLSFSGGKDSTVLKHLIDSMYDDVPAVFVNTGLEYPEIQRFVKDIKNGKHENLNTNVEILYPKKNFRQIVEEYGYPVISKEVAKDIYYARRGNEYCLKKMNGQLIYEGKKSMYCHEKWLPLMDAPFKISASCCGIMKEQPMHRYESNTKRKPFVGTMASESLRRYSAWLRTGCNAFDSNKPISKPLSIWTDQDVLHYIKKYNVPISEAYGDIVEDNNEIEGQETMFDYIYHDQTKLKTTGCSRTGCMFCMFGVHLEKEPNRFQRMKQTHPKQWDYCIHELGLGKVLDYIGVKYE